MRGSKKAVLAAAVVGVVGAGLGGGGTRAMGQVYTLQHTNSIDLSALFTSTSGYGNNSLSVAFDGANAYVGGYNNSGGAGNVGVVQVQGVLGAGPTAGGLASTQFSASASRGLDAMASDGTYLYVSHDSGSAATSFIEKIRLSDMSVVWQTFSPNGQRPMAMAIDPTGDGGAPAIAFLAQGNGRRLALKDADGSVLYTISGGANPGGIINSSPTLGTAWRGMAFDSAGGIALAEDSGVAYGVRVNDNRWKDLAGVNDQTTRSDLKSLSQNNVGNGVALLEGATAASPLLVFAPRVAGNGSATALTLTDSTGAVTNANSGDVQIRNVDGTATGLPQTALHGNEDGIGGAFTTELKNFAVAKDANGLPVLLAVSSLEKRLDVYQMEPTYAADADGAWSESGKWLAGVVPNSATLNARFGPTTGGRTITVDGGQTTKDLKLDSPNGYTFVGGTLNVSGPAGQNGNVQVLQGTHAIQNGLSLAKTTVFSVASGAGLSVTGGVTGAGGLTKAGGGAMTLGNSNTIAGALGVSGGTLDVAGSVSGVTRISGSGTSASPAVLNVTGTVALAADGTDAGTSKVSADTTLTVGPAGKVDLADNDVVWDYNGASPIDAIRGYLLNGRAGGAWNGAGGIASSAAAAAGGVTGIGYIEGATLGVTTFSGQQVGATSVLLKYTYAGDANLDGVINGDDYTLVDKGRAAGVGNAHWVDGDFDYDGSVTSADYFLIDRAYGMQSGGLSPGLLAEREAEFGTGYVSELVAAVPEPGALGVVGALAVGMASRRRRKA